MAKLAKRAQSFTDTSKIVAVEEAGELIEDAPEAPEAAAGATEPSDGGTPAEEGPA